MTSHENKEWNKVISQLIQATTTHEKGRVVTEQIVNVSCAHAWPKNFIPTVLFSPEVDKQIPTIC